MKNTKVKIWFESVNSRKKEYCTIVVENKQSKEEVLSKLDYGCEYNEVIQSIVDFNHALMDWGVVSITYTDSEINLVPEYIKIAKKTKTKTVKSDERIVTDFLLKCVDLGIPEITKLYHKLENKALQNELLDADHSYWLKINELTQEEWDFYCKNNNEWIYYRPTPYSIKQKYALSMAKTEEEKKKAKEIVQPKIFKYDNVLSGQYIKVINFNTMEFFGQVDYKHFERYIRHLNANVTMDYAQEYENVRCELHDVIFNALGGERKKDRDKFGVAIDTVVKYCYKCLCGSGLNYDKECIKCGTKFKPEYAIENLKLLIIK